MQSTPSWKNFRPPTGWAFGLRSRGIWLVLLALVPAVLVVVFSSVDRRRQDSESVLRDQSQLAQVVTTSYERQLSNAQSALGPLSVIFGLAKGDIQSARGPVCDSFLNDILRANPAYLNFIVAGLNGAVVCSAHPLAESDYASSSFFRGTVETRKLTVGSFRADSSNRWVDVGIPVASPEGAVFAVLLATLDLKSFDAIAANLQLPDRSTIEVTDSNGVTLSSWPESDSRAGLTNPGASFDPATAAPKLQGTENSAGGEKRLYATSVLRTPDGTPVARIKLSVPESVAFSASNAALRRDLLLLAAGGVATLLAAWWLSGRVLLRPMGRLMLATERIAGGDLSARVGPNYERSEMGTLGRTFDAMAQTLVEQTDRIQDANRELESRVEERTAELIAVNRQLGDANNELQRLLDEGRSLEAKLLQRTADLEVANRELGSFAYSVSHDLRAPLRAIDGFSHTLIRDYSDRLDERGVQRLERVRAAAQRMSGLIDDLLSLSRTSRVQMNLQEVDLAQMAWAVADQLKDNERSREVEFVIGSEVNVTADAGLMRILLENLMSNAWKFTSQHERAVIEVGTAEEDGERKYYVRDDGAGFDMEYADKLFGAFQRLHAESEFPGYGIGLATAQRIVRRHGGRIWARGALEEGATIFFTLNDAPVAQHMEEAA